MNANIVLLAGAAYLAYNILLSRAGGANFFKSGETGSLGSGATVVKIQLSLDSDWSQPDNIMETLGKLSSGNSRDRGLLTGRTELSTLLSETALALLRRKDAWSAAALAGERFTGGDDVAQRVEPFFQSAVVQERSKFEAEVAPSHGTMNSDSNSNSKEYNTDQDFMGRTATQMLVSLVVALRGRSEVLSARPAAVTSAEVARCLQTLASEALSDEGENVLGVEVLWTPSERGRTLSSKDLLLEYPELMSL